ncbi:formylglycine-generating enzyme family protein [Actinopolymorpha pittospori]
MSSTHTTTEPVVLPGSRPGKKMVWVPGGTFAMGSQDFYPEERPVRQVDVDGFWMDEHPVTVAEYRRFVRATGYVTVAERSLDPSRHPGLDPRLLAQGSLVFHKTPGPVDLSDHRSWWSYVPGACWRRPEGAGSSVHGRERHPVTHVAYEDAEAYAIWSGKELPTEAEWEYASRGGLDGAIYAWGDDFSPQGRLMANTWQGEFPWRNAKLDRFERTSPIGMFPANGYGLLDMTGNVWEWTCDLYHTRPGDRGAKATCVPHTKRQSLPRQRAAEDAPRDSPGGAPDGSAGDGDSPDGSAGGWAGDGGADEAFEHAVVRVIKGGSYLCCATFCLRYRPAARQAMDSDSATCHLGFRCVVRPR